MAGGAAAGAGGTSKLAVRVMMTPDNRLDPPQVTVNQGQVVQFINAGRAPCVFTDDPTSAADKSHAASPPGTAPWSTGMLNSGRSATQLVTVPGDYSYFAIPGKSQGLVGLISER